MSNPTIRRIIPPKNIWEKLRIIGDMALRLFETNTLAMDEETEPASRRSMPMNSSEFPLLHGLLERTVTATPKKPRRKLKNRVMHNLSFFCIMCATRAEMTGDEPMITEA